jgi:hypothetical protein
MITMEEYPKIILTRPKIVVDTRCPKCKSMDIAATPIVTTVCKNCSTKFESDTGVNIYYSMAKKLNQLLANNNGVVVQGERDNSMTFHPDDALRPRSKMEDDIWHAILAIHTDFVKQKCWEVSKISNEVDVDFKIYCKDCGYCKNCVTCNKCGEHYTPRLIEGKKEIRYTCPKCNSKSYRDTIIDKFKNKRCPYCESPKVVHSKFDSTKKKCPKCGSENITEPRKVPVYRFIIERQKRNRID